MYELALYDSRTQFELEFIYEKGQIYIIIDEANGTSNYADGGIKIDKEKNTVEMYGLYDFESIEQNLINVVKENSYVKKLLK